MTAADNSVFDWADTVVGKLLVRDGKPVTS